VFFNQFLLLKIAESFIDLEVFLLLLPLELGPLTLSLSEMHSGD